MTVGAPTNNFSVLRRYHHGAQEVGPERREHFHESVLTINQGESTKHFNHHFDSSYVGKFSSQSTLFDAGWECCNRIEYVLRCSP